MSVSFTSNTSNIISDSMKSGECPTTERFFIKSYGMSTQPLSALLMS